MKTMLTAFAAVILIAVLANYGLQQLNFSSKEEYSTKNVRLD